MASPDEVATLPPLVEVAASLGISARQARYWAERGYVEVVPVNHNRTHEVARSGSGYLSLIRPDEAVILGLVARLLAAGLALPVAGRVAREAVERDGTVDLAPGVRLEITE